MSKSMLVSLVLCLGLSADAATSKRRIGKITGTGATKPTFTLNKPDGGWTLDRMVEVSGTVSDRTVDLVTINMNGNKYYIRVTGNGSFSRKFPVVSGKNTVIVQGTNKGGTGQLKRSFFAKVSPVPIMAILTSDTDGVYTDLHVYEPNPDLEDPIRESQTSNYHVFWSRTSSPSGAKFYLNAQAGSYDQPGYGPYLYTHESPPLGIYRLDANYWPSGSKAHTLSTLDLVLFGGTSSEIKKKVKLPLVMPGETLTLAWVRIDKGQQAYVYVPTQDDKPRDTKIWPQWVQDYQVRKTR